MPVAPEAPTDAFEQTHTVNIHSQAKVPAAINAS